MGLARKPRKRASVVPYDSEIETTSVKSVRKDDFETRAPFSGEKLVETEDSTFLLIVDRNTKNSYNFEDFCSDYPLLCDAWDSILGSNNLEVFFDGSRFNPIEEASLLLENQWNESLNLVLEEDEEEISHPDDCTPIQLSNHFLICSKSSESPLEQSFHDDDDSAFDSSWSSLSGCDSLSTFDDSSLGVQEFDRVSFLDLNANDLEWVSNKENGFSLFQYSLPNAACSFDYNSQCGCSDSSALSLSNVKSCSDDLSLGQTDFGLECLDIEEPLFWPFDPDSYWCHNIVWVYTCLSPATSNKQNNSMAKWWPESKPVKLEFQPKKKLISERESERKSSERRKEKIASTSSSGSTVSRFLPRGKTSEKTRILGNETENSKERRRESLDPNCFFIETLTRLSLEDCEFLEDGFMSGEESVEALVGMKEFDGCEGIQGEFDGDKFSLD
ncbi:hypothetical protein AMTRI_Chr06g179110 [Amborella trichopoda]